MRRIENMLQHNPAAGTRGKNPTERKSRLKMARGYTRIMGGAEGY
jgi:hypothetical protein